MLSDYKPKAKKALVDIFGDIITKGDPVVFIYTYQGELELFIRYCHSHDKIRVSVGGEFLTRTQAILHFDNEVCDKTGLDVFYNPTDKGDHVLYTHRHSFREGKVVGIHDEWYKIKDKTTGRIYNRKSYNCVKIKYDVDGKPKKWKT